MIEAICFYTFGGLMLAAALLVVLSRQPIYSVLSLLVAMFCLAGLFVMLGAFFVAALQILLYAGAVLVLFLFVIMLLNLDAETLARLRPFTRRGLGTIVAVLFCGLLLGLLTSTRASSWTATPTPPALPAAPSAAQAGTVEQLGRLLFTKYLLPFELTSFLILAAIIAAVTLARSKDTE